MSRAQKTDRKAASGVVQWTLRAISWFCAASGYLRLRFEDLFPMDLDPVFLARIQFAFTIAFHIIFPSFTIGLSAYIATLGALWLRTDNERYHRLMRFWTKIFAV